MPTATTTAARPRNCTLIEKLANGKMQLTMLPEDFKTSSKLQIIWWRQKFGSTRIHKMLCLQWYFQKWASIISSTTFRNKEVNLHSNDQPFISHFTSVRWLTRDESLKWTQQEFLEPFSILYVFNHTVLWLVQEICYLFSILSTHCSFFLKCWMYRISTLILPSFSHVKHMYKWQSLH